MMETFFDALRRDPFGTAPILADWLDEHDRPELAQIARHAQFTQPSEAVDHPGIEADIRRHPEVSPVRPAFYNPGTYTFIPSEDRAGVQTKDNVRLLNVEGAFNRRPALHWTPAEGINLTWGLSPEELHAWVRLLPKNTTRANFDKAARYLYGHPAPHPLTKAASEATEHAIQSTPDAAYSVPNAQVASNARVKAQLAESHSIAGRDSERRRYHKGAAEYHAVLAHDLASPEHAAAADAHRAAARVKLMRNDDIQQLEYATRADPTNGQLWEALSQLYAAAGDTAKAAEAKALASLFGRARLARPKTEDAANAAFSASKRVRDVIKKFHPEQIGDETFPGYRAYANALRARSATGPSRAWAHAAAARDHEKEAARWKKIDVPYADEYIAAHKAAQDAHARAVHAITNDVGKDETKITGEAWRQNVPGKSGKTVYKIDPQIAGTALAYHLRSIANEGKPDTAALAQYALAGKTPPGVNGDVYAALGRRLTRANHPLARAYNWDKMSNGLSIDNWLEKFIRRNVQSLGRPDHEYFDMVRRQFGNGSGKNKGYHAFWSRLQKAAKDDAFVLTRAHHEDLQQVIEDALHRISDRHLDREYIRQKGDKSVFSAAPRGALKFARRGPVKKVASSDFSNLLRTYEQNKDPGILPILADAIGDSTGDSDDPRAQILRAHHAQTLQTNRNHNGFDELIDPADGEARYSSWRINRSTPALYSPYKTSLFLHSFGGMPAAVWEIRRHDSSAGNRHLVEDYNYFNMPLETPEKARAFIDKFGSRTRNRWEAWLHDNIARPAANEAVRQTVEMHGGQGQDIRNPKADTHRRLAAGHTRRAQEYNDNVFAPRDRAAAAAHTRAAEWLEHFPGVS